MRDGERRESRERGGRFGRREQLKKGKDARRIESVVEMKGESRDQRHTESKRQEKKRDRFLLFAPLPLLLFFVDGLLLEANKVISL